MEIKITLEQIDDFIERFSLLKQMENNNATAVLDRIEQRRAGYEKIKKEEVLARKRHNRALLGIK